MTKIIEGHLTTPDGVKLAYVKTVGKSPGIVFLGGYMSDMTGIKAQALENFCQKTSLSFVRFDYRGHGASTGLFEMGTISKWTSDTLAVIDSLTEGPQILVGSSMGGWLMLLAAIARKPLISGLVGIAAATDFTQRLLDDDLTKSQLTELRRTGITRIHSPYSETPYVFTRSLLQDGQTQLLLDKPIDLHCPVRLFHGMLDTSVPWKHSLKLANALSTSDVEITLIKDGDHRLSDPVSIDRLLQTVRTLIPA
jgi:pimeloyl-ACP methyl ester carboxylesterase